MRFLLRCLWTFSMLSIKKIQNSIDVRVKNSPTVSPNVAKNSLFNFNQKCNNLIVLNWFLFNLESRGNKRGCGWHLNTRCRSWALICGVWNSIFSDVLYEKLGQTGYDLLNFMRKNRNFQFLKFTYWKIWSLWNVLHIAGKRESTATRWHTKFSCKNSNSCFYIQCSTALKYFIGQCCSPDPPISNYT